MALVNFNFEGIGKYVVYFDSDLNQIFLCHLFLVGLLHITLFICTSFSSYDIMKIKSI